MFVCDRCGKETKTIISYNQHRKWCERVPRPDDLAREYETGPRLVELADKYDTNVRMIHKHLKRSTHYATIEKHHRFDRRRQKQEQKRRRWLSRQIGRCPNCEMLWQYTEGKDESGVCLDCAGKTKRFRDKYPASLMDY